MDDRPDRIAEPDEPILIGAAQWTGRQNDPSRTPAPQDLLAEICRQAGDNAGLDGQLLRTLDAVAVIRLFADSAPQFATPFGGSSNWPKSLTDRLGAKPSRLTYPSVGGDTPQMMVFEYADALARGEIQFAAIASVELSRTARLAQKAGIELDWNEDPGGEAELIGDLRPGYSPIELRHGLGLPIDTYPLFENALAHFYGRDQAVHQSEIATLVARFSQVAATHPMAATQQALTAAEISAIDRDNRMIAWPYTKRMSANIMVDQSAAVLMTTVGLATKMGIDRNRWIFLRGAAEAADKWLVTERSNYHSAPALGLAARAALEQADLNIEDLNYFDIYSCFPSAIEIAADEIGLSHNDPRGLTVTGGMAFFGGPGNAYSLHALAEMIEKLRADPGSAGMVTSNGWYLTKHAIGIYSTDPGRNPWTASDNTEFQAQIGAMSAPPFINVAEGDGRIETFSISFGRSGPERGIVIGRLDSGERFIANTAADPRIFDRMMRDTVIGLPVSVASNGGRNTVSLMN